jgi:hypothetical protein
MDRPIALILLLVAVFGVAMVAQNYARRGTGEDRGASPPIGTNAAPTSVPTSAAPSVPKRSHITLEIQEHTYSSGGHYIVSGIARNDGDADVFSPTIVLELKDSSGALLARETTSPVGQTLSTMAPGTAAAFRLSALLSGRPQVSTNLYVDKVEYSVRQR